MHVVQWERDKRDKGVKRGKGTFPTFLASSLTPLPKPYTPNDAWSQRAAKEGFRARSVYKLQELDQRFKLLKSGMVVLDLGAAPGSWLQYASKQVGERGQVVGIDIADIAEIGENVKTFIRDILDTEGVLTILKNEGWEYVDLVLSDIAPSTSGIKDVDQWRSIELNQGVLQIAERVLRPGGRCVLKVFRGADFDAFLREIKASWRGVKTVQVKASRDRSKEIYLVVEKA